MKVLILIPVYNSWKTLPLLIDEIDKALEGEGIVYSYLFSDDKSNVETRNYLEGLLRKRDNVKVIFQEENLGQQENLRRAVKEVSEDIDIVITMDDDGQHPAYLLKEIIGKIEEGYDLVYASATPFGRKSPLRALGSFMRDKMFQRLFHIGKDLRLSSFRGVKGELVRKIAEADKPFFYFSCEALKENPRAVSIGYSYIERKDGKSSYSCISLAILYFKIYHYYKGERS